MDDRTLTLEAATMHGSKSNEMAPRMLIADDDPCVLRVIAERCARMGFEVETATNGLKALTEAIRYNPDIVVIDVHLPEIDGLSVCALLQDLTRQFPRVLVMTGRPGQEIVERCEGFDVPCIHKGHNFWNLLETRLAEKYPHMAGAIKQSGKRPGGASATRSNKDYVGKSAASRARHGFYKNPSTSENCMKPCKGFAALPAIWTANYSINESDGIRCFTREPQRFPLLIFETSAQQRMVRRSVRGCKR